MDDDTSPGAARPSVAGQTPQQMLWVDGVGGYLVCLGPEISLGHPGAGAAGGPGPDVGLLADLASRHAKIRRVEGGWLLTPLGPVAMNGLPLDGPTALVDGAELLLGDALRLRYRRPHSLSTTAVLTVESGQRIVTRGGGPAADAVLLMAESCVLGPKRHNHVHCRDWSDDAILFRGAEGLLCRAPGEVAVDGEPASGPIVIRPGTRIEGQDFALSVEAVEGRG